MGQPGSPTILILGLGNPLTGDDAFGAQVLGFVRQAEAARLPGISLADAHTDLLNHLEDFPAHDQVILVDAILDPEHKLGAPGRVIVLRENDFLAWSENSPSVHQMSPLMTVKLFRQLYPDAQTRFSLVGLLIDQLTHSLHYATEERIREAACAVLSLFAPKP